MVMRINRSLLNWGVFLVALGGVPLAVEQGWLTSDVVGDLLKVWPLILVGIGLGLMLRWTILAWLGGAIVAATFGIIFGALAAAAPDDGLSSWQGIVPAIALGACGSADGGQATADGDLASATSFAVDVRLSCARLDMSRGAGATWNASARHAGDVEPAIAGTPSELHLSQRGTDEVFVLGHEARTDWLVELPASATLSLAARLDATDGEIDLDGAPVADVAATLNASDLRLDLTDTSGPTPLGLDLALNASSVRLVLPAGSVSGQAKLNASSLDICLPQGAAARIGLTAVLASDDLSDAGLVRSGDAWQTEGYDAAPARVDLSITSTVSSVSIERPEVCA